MSKNKAKKTSVIDKVIDEVVEEVVEELLAESSNEIIPKLSVPFKTLAELRDYLISVPKGVRDIDVTVLDAMNHLERMHSLIKFIESARK